MSGLSKRQKRSYTAAVPLARRPHDNVTPLPHLAELDRWVDHWVAVKDDRVIAASKSSRELAYKLREMGPKAKGAVMQYVRPPSDAYIVGVG